MTEQELAECREWVRSRPASVQVLMRRFPPACYVRPLRPLVCPRVEGVIFSYTEDGQVSVIEEGNATRGFCNPNWLEYVRPGKVTPQQIAEWLNPPTAADSGEGA